MAGPFLLAALAYGAAAIVLVLLLHPDPLLQARQLATEAPAQAGGTTTGTGTRLRGAVLLGAAVMILTQLVMVAIMTMTPVHMTAHGHGVGAAGAVIAVHVAAMYLPSPISGWLVDRIGRVPVAAASGATLPPTPYLAASIARALS